MTESTPTTQDQTDTPPHQEQDGLPTPQRYFAIATLLLIIALSVIDSSITNIALPTISQALNVTPASSVWIVNAYSITIIATLLPFSALAEKIGFKRLSRIGIVVFLIGAIGSMFAESLSHLISTRIIQGLGCSALMSIFGGLVRHIYPRQKIVLGISLNAVMVGVAALFSPSLGAFIIKIASWHWIYGFAIPLSFIAFIMTTYFPRVKRIDKSFDFLSALLNALTFGCFIAALDLAFSQPLFSLCFFGLSIVTGYFLYHRSLGQAHPLVPIDLLRIVAFRDAIIVSSMSFASASLTMISAPFYFQSGLGMSATTIGFIFSAWPIATLVIAPITGKLSHQYPSSILAGLGSLTMAVGLACLLLLPADAHPFYFALCVFITGLGFGFLQTPNNKAILLSAPPHRASATGGMQSTARLFGQCTGAALVAVCFTLSTTQGHFYGILLGCITIGLASFVNLGRYLRKTDISV